MTEQSSKYPSQGKQNSVLVQQNGQNQDQGQLAGNKDRIVYLNDALSGLHGSKLRSIAQDIYRSRKAIYEGHKRKWAEPQQRAYLEAKVPEFMDAKYASLYGLYDGVHVPEAGSKTADFSLQVPGKAKDSMRAGILAMRLLNKRLAGMEPVSRQIFSQETFLGKRLSYSE